MDLIRFIQNSLNTVGNRNDAQYGVILLNSDEFSKWSIPFPDVHQYTGVHTYTHGSRRFIIKLITDIPPGTLEVSYGDIVTKFTKE